MVASNRKILLLGSGYVAKPCCNVLLRRTENQLTIASRRLEHAQKLAEQLNAELASDAVNTVQAKQCNVDDPQSLESLIKDHDVVISLIPYTYHAQVIQLAIKHKKHVVTTSYVNPQMAALDAEAKAAGVTVMNEIGLDPGIDHLYAVKTIEEVHNEGGQILEFISYCGGLPAPENSNNPLGYKFSWSSRGVLLALRNTAKYLAAGKPKEIPGPELMKSAKSIQTGYPAFAFVGYPNRDSVPYAKLYNIPEAQTVLRGTLRFQGFPVFVQALVDVGMLDDTQDPQLNPSSPSVNTWRELLVNKFSLAKDASAKDILAYITKKANLDKLTVDERAHIEQGLYWLGILSDLPLSPRGTLLDTLCALLEEKMKYNVGERDLVFLQHVFLVKTKEGKMQRRTSTLLEYGEPIKPAGSKQPAVTAMAKTVGVPCGIATQLILDGKLTDKGVLAPMNWPLCSVLIDALKKENIEMIEDSVDLE